MPSCILLNFLYSLTEPFAPAERDTHPLPILAHAMTMLATNVTQDSTLSPNEFVLCLQALLRPSMALSPCKIEACMRALIPSPVPACLRSLLRPSLALSPSEFTRYMSALTPSPVPAGFRHSSSLPGQPALAPGQDRQPCPHISGITQHGSWLGEPALHTSRTICCFLPDNILHIAIRGYLLLPSPHIIEYSDNTLIVFFLWAPQHPLYHPPAPFPDNSTMIVVVVSVWAILFM